MQSVSVAYAKDKLPSLLHLVEQGENIQITRHGKTVAVITCPGGASVAADAPSPFERAYRAFRARIESDNGYSEKDWNDYFNIPRAVEMDLRHGEDFT